ncbi:MAG: prolipoprotein diacylglyceryl transferase family protein [Verrucomicrobiota bacterium]
MPPQVDHALLPGSGVYRAIMVGGLLVSFLLWLKFVRRDRRMIAVYLGAVLGGFTGAKIVFVLAEGWLFWGKPEFWGIILSGKTIVGALLGGYAGVEIGKASVGYKSATGDWFALIVPLGIAAGRIGCLSAGCCQGIALESGSLWPAAAVELGFNLTVFVILWPLRKITRLNGQLFHIYLIAYGIFRFAHEFLRATEKPFLSLSGYQLAAIALVALAVIRYRQRSRCN